jgi:RNA polymerase sigma-70 factor (ECF subfamily)
MSQAELGVSMGEAGWTAVDDERDLIERAKTDREAFAVLYRRHCHPVFAYVYRRTGARHATEDVVSEVFLTALRTLSRYRYRGVPLRYWLLRIATNAVNRWARRQRHWGVRLVATEQIDDRRHDPPSTGGETDPEQARRALLSLPPKYQSVLALHYFEGLALQEIAAIIGCRLGTVKSRLARARDALRVELNQRR